jgi:hypothetical protein
MSLRLLSSILPIGFVVVPMGQEPVHHQIFINETTVQFMVLFHAGNHWQLVAQKYDEDTWQVLFDPRKVPFPFCEIAPHIPHMLQWAPHIGPDDQGLEKRPDAWFRVLEKVRI